MGEILGMGLSHYPGPVVPPEFWGRMLARNVEVGRIPQAVFDDKSRWPQLLRQEWGNDEGRAAAERHSERLMAGYRRLRAELDAFKPDFVVIWGDDQYENFKQSCIPPFCVYIFDQITCRPYSGGKRVFKTDRNAWGLPDDAEMVVKGHRAGARALVQYLIDHDFDTAYAYSTISPAGLAHSHNNTVLFLDHENGAFPYPVVPIHVNCYGSQLMKTAAGSQGEGIQEISPPAPTPRRCFELGRATARCFKESPWRVALIASSSWSHASLTAKHQRLYPDLPADRRRYDELVNGRFTTWGSIDPAEVEDAGQNEMLNWICLAGAMAETGQTFEPIDYIESHLFNSSKCFGLFPCA